jgi:hypothetical protein
VSAGVNGLAQPDGFGLRPARAFTPAPLPARKERIDMATNLSRVVSTSAAYTGKGGLKSVTLQGGSANSTVDIRDNVTGTGAVIMSLAAVANTTSHWHSNDPDGVFLGTGCHLTLAGTGASCAVEIE